MKKICCIIIVFVCTLHQVTAQKDSLIQISPDLQLVKLSSNVYQHISYKDYGSIRIGSNGLVYTSENEAILIDTPVSDTLTIELIEYFLERGVSIEAVVPGHWHDDCLAGLGAAHAYGIQSFANNRTGILAAEAGYVVPENEFSDSLIFLLGKEQVECRFLGAGHTTDNIVVYLPAEHILFGGCMVKSLESNGLGYTNDADVEKWPITIKRIQEKYADAQIIVPGHGAAGNLELLNHTLKLLNR